jgi:hypothetical protein
LEAQLEHIGIFKPSETLIQHIKLDEKFKVSKYWKSPQSASSYISIKAEWVLTAVRNCLDLSTVTVWANHGDEISIQYSGTQALKGDFVR